MVFSDIHVYMLCHFLSDLSQRVDAVKDENLKLKSENQVQIKTFFFQSVVNIVHESNNYPLGGTSSIVRPFQTPK